MKMEKIGLPAEQLGISEEEYAALIEVRHRLATGAINFSNFSMCSCVCCIGGHMATIMNINPVSYVDRNACGATVLTPLFYPICMRASSQPSDFPPSRCVLAIDRFLAGCTTGLWD